MPKTKRYGGRKEKKRTKRSGEDDVTVTKVYEMSDLEKEGGLFVSEYYLSGGSIDYKDYNVSRYRIDIAPDITIYHTIIKDGHKLKNIIRFKYDDYPDSASEEM